MFFRKKRKRFRPAPSWITRGIDKERRFRKDVSLWLLLRSRRLSPNRLRLYCFVFVLAGTLSYTWIIVRAIRGDNMPISVKSIELPSAALRHPLILDEKVPPSFRQFLDSINRTPELKRHFDSLMVARPGFADTIRQLEAYFPGNP